MTTRTEHDSMGPLEVPADALWGAQTQRAVQNFAISDRRMPAAFIRALALLKANAATVNARCGLLDEERAVAIHESAMDVCTGSHDAEFPIDVFQTGSGTSSNMNANEVIATLATQASGVEIHPNDHVNLGQSSNDMIPSAIAVSACLQCSEVLIPSIQHLVQVCRQRSDELAGTVKTGRTHLMDAMPVTLGQELACWADQLESGSERITDALLRLGQLPAGGTAVGTGINAHPDFAGLLAEELKQETGFPFESADNKFVGIASQDAAMELSGQLKTLACSLMKIANDLRLMNSGPLAGLGELSLPALQPGSSIMPGKVNPVVPEAVAMVAAQVIGNDAAITVAALCGLFQLNVMLPMVASNLLESIAILGTAARALADQAIAGFEVNEDQLDKALERNPILVTALNPVIGYEAGAAIAKTAYREGRPVREVALEMTDLDEETIDRLLDPLALTRGGIDGL